MERTTHGHEAGHAAHVVVVFDLAECLVDLFHVGDIALIRLYTSANEYQSKDFKRRRYEP